MLVGKSDAAISLASSGKVAASLAKGVCVLQPTEALQAGLLEPRI